jgi:hypothetical protein
MDESILCNCEDEFFNEIKNKHTLMCSVGVKHSGKTLLMGSIFRYLIENNFYDKFHLVASNFQNEQKGSYEAMFKNIPDKKLKNITVYEKYSDQILENILKDTKHRKLILFDDASSTTDLFKNGELLKKLTFESRHKFNCSIWFVVHSIKGILSTWLRSNVEFWFIHRITNINLYKALWEEFLSIQIPKFKDFQKFIKDEFLNSSEFPSLLFWSDKQKIDIDIFLWSKVHFGKKFILKNLS